MGDRVEHEDWVLEMWLETCRNHGIEVEVHERKDITRMRTIIAMRKAGIMD